MEVTPQAGSLGLPIGRMIANPQARIVTPQKSQGTLPTQKPLQEGKRSSLRQGTGKILGKKLFNPSKKLNTKGRVENERFVGAEGAAAQEEREEVAARPPQS